ncbi:MAG: hypothetical protein KF684_06300 [Phycisphaeraceae bacterium]|nr:hypothetical protein [Phycisphaeraceae bacterium]
MTQSAKATAEAKTPLNAAQTIVEELKGMNAEDQSLALQFAIQTLRLALPTVQAPVAQGPAYSAIPHSHAASGVPATWSDIKSFTSAKAPKSDQQFTAVVAYYYQYEAPERDRKDFIDPETMKEAARMAGRPQVKRWAMTLSNAKNAGYLDSAGHGKFKLNSVGENLVAITLPESGAGGRKSGGAAKKKPRKKKAPGKRSAKKAR